MIEIILVGVIFYGGGYLLIKWLENLSNSGKGSLLYPVEKESSRPLNENNQETEKTTAIENDRNHDLDYDTYIRSIMKSDLNSDSKQALQARVYDTFDTFGKEWLEDIDLKLLASMDYSHNRGPSVIERDNKSNITVSDYQTWVEEAFLNWFTKNAEILGVSRIDKDAYIDHLKQNGCDMAFNDFIKINNKPNSNFESSDYMSIISSLKSQSSLEIPEIENINFDSRETIKLIQDFEAKQADKNDRELLSTVNDILTQSNFVLNEQFWENNLYILHKIALNFKDYISAQKFASLIYSISNESTYAYQAYGEAALYDALKFKQSIGDSLMFDPLGTRSFFSFPDAITHFIRQIEINHEYKEEKETFYKVKSLILLSVALHKINDSEYGTISKSLFDIAKSQATKALPLKLGFGNLPFNDKEFIYSSWDVVESTWLK